MVREGGVEPRDDMALTCSDSSVARGSRELGASAYHLEPPLMTYTRPGVQGSSKDCRSHQVTLTPTPPGRRDRDVASMSVGHVRPTGGRGRRQSLALVFVSHRLCSARAERPWFELVAQGSPVLVIDVAAVAARRTGLLAWAAGGPIPSPRQPSSWRFGGTGRVVTCDPDAVLLLGAACGANPSLTEASRRSVSMPPSPYGASTGVSWMVHAESWQVRRGPETKQALMFASIR